MKTSSFLLLLITTAADAMTTSSPPKAMKRILCLHGKSQSGTVLANKIAGARRKLARVYELDFLDAPVEEDSSGEQLAWWILDDQRQEILVDKAFEYVIRQTEGKQYDALLGFSQGGLLATALALSGKMPEIQAVVTAGAPYRQLPFDIALSLASETETAEGKAIPKLHFAGETDAMIPVQSVYQLCEAGGNGEVVVHDKGHLFPTKAVHVNYMMEFLEKSLASESEARKES
eukprot:scaffold2068_cov96-Cylindrotheca_fusiformis.AAC.2